MTEPSHMEAAKVRCYRQASEWLLRLNGEDLPEEDVAEWLHWCEADPANLTAFERLQQDWRDLAALKEIRNPLQLPLRARSPAAARKAAPRRRAAARRLFQTAAKWGLAAGFALLLTSAGLEWSRYAAPPPVKTTLLPDGSTVVLSPKAAVAVDFTGPLRHVELNEGEAYVKVHHDKTRPFVVEAGDLTVTAVGTAFDVRRDADRVIVTVEEGTVRIASQGAQKPGQWTATAGYQLAYSTRSGNASMVSVDAANVLRWRSGELAYVGAPLGTVIDDVNRYSNRRIVIHEATLDQIHYTGTVFTGYIDDWLRALDKTYPVRSVQGSNGDIQLESATPESGVSRQ